MIKNLPTILPISFGSNPKLSSQIKTSVSISDSKNITRLRNSEEEVTKNNRQRRVMTSINRPVSNVEQENADDARYSYSQRLINARKVRELALDKKNESQQKENKSLAIKTGSMFSRDTRYGLDRVLKLFAKQNRALFNSINSTDRKFIADLIQKHAQNKSVGSNFNFYEKKNLKGEIERNKEGGKISRFEADKFKKIIDLLE